MMQVKETGAPTEATAPPTPVTASCGYMGQPPTVWEETHGYTRGQKS